MTSHSSKYSLRGSYERAKSFLRRYSQGASLTVGLALAIVFAFLWYRNTVGPILGSLFIGIGASIIAATIVAYFSPFNESAYRRFISLGIDNTWSSRETVPERIWVDWIRHAKQTCTLLGVAHGNWCDDPGFEPALRDRLRKGVWVKILFLDPNGAAADLRAREEGRGKHQRDTKEKIRGSIIRIWRFRESLEPGVIGRLRIYVYDATPSCGLTWVDDQMIVTHYLAGSVDLTSPAILLKPAKMGTGGLFDVYAKNVDKIETEWSIELDDRNIHQYLPKTETETIPAAGTSIIPTRQVEERGSDVDVD
jgi:Domain of unknown function (DUF5919)